MAEMSRYVCTPAVEAHYQVQRALIAGRCESLSPACNEMENSVTRNRVILQKFTAFDHI
jgi:hypothetical protein